MTLNHHDKLPDRMATWQAVRPVNCRASREIGRQRLESARDVTTYAHRSLSFVVILELFSTLPIATAKVTIVEK